MSTHDAPKDSHDDSQRGPLSAAGAGIDDVLDAAIGEYSDRVHAGERPAHGEFLARVPARGRPGLERCLKLVDAGVASAGSLALGPGVELGRFVVQREIGRGGMSVVYLATDPELRRPVALKVLRPGLALEASHVDRFRREGRAVAQLSHPGVVQVYEVGTTSGVHWIAMEYVAGPSLATVIDAVHGEGAPTPDGLARAVGDLGLADLRTFDIAAARLLAPALDGLLAAHAAGLVHRDIKPTNILIRPDGKAVLADFGLARADGDPGLSLTGEPLGTPHYMAPEQAHAAQHGVDERTDVYAFGVTLYELLSGQRPFVGDSIIEVLDAIRFQRPRPLASVAPTSGEDARAVVRKATMREAERRYASGAALAADMRCVAEGVRTDALREAGGVWQRLWADLGDVFTGRAEEARSSIEFLGWPLVHVVGAPLHAGFARALPKKSRTAKGWIAIGPKAIGGFAMGGISFGLLTLGGLSFGALALGGSAVGGVTAGGCSIGVRSFGGLAVGDVAMGGMAIGRGAIGGFAMGRYTLGGDTYGTYEARLGWEGQGDDRVIEFFRQEPEPFRSIYMDAASKLAEAR